VAYGGLESLRAMVPHGSVPSAPIAVCGSSLHTRPPPLQSASLYGVLFLGFFSSGMDMLRVVFLFCLLAIFSIQTGYEIEEVRLLVSRS